MTWKNSLKKQQYLQREQLQLNFNCKHEVREEKVLRADQEWEAPYMQVIKICRKCGKEIV